MVLSITRYNNCNTRDHNPTTGRCERSYIAPGNGTGYRRVSQLDGAETSRVAWLAPYVAFSIDHSGLTRVGASPPTSLLLAWRVGEGGLSSRLRTTRGGQLDQARDSRAPPSNLGPRLQYTAVPRSVGALGTSTCMSRSQSELNSLIEGRHRCTQ